MTISIENTTWKAEHSDLRFGGPVALVVGNAPLFQDFHCSMEGQEDSQFVPDMTPRVYHKAGLAVYECEAHLAAAPGMRLHQVLRYGANHFRAVYDLSWAKETAMTAPVEVASCTLVGRWSRVLAVPRGTTPAQAQWQPIGAETLVWEDAPASLLVEREDGLRLEYSLGFDLWRWDHGLGITSPSRMELVPGAEGLALRHFVAVPPPLPEPPEGEEAPLGPIPEARQYRFCAMVAWSVPATPSGELAEVPLAFAADGRLDTAQLRSLELATQVPVIDFQQMPGVDSFRRLAPDGSRSAFCWECDRVLTLAKKLIRQVAALGSEGTLVLRGLQPGFCQEARHCDKKGALPHWDLEDIVTFVNWCHAQLGPGWRLLVPQKDGWEDLPSLQGLSLPIGFDY